MTRDTYEIAEEQGISTPGQNCANCGNAGFEHDKERVNEGNGRYSYDYVCPEES